MSGLFSVTTLLNSAVSCNLTRIEKFSSDFENWHFQSRKNTNKYLNQLMMISQRAVLVNFPWTMHSFL